MPVSVRLRFIAIHPILPTFVELNSAASATHCTRHPMRMAAASRQIDALSKRRAWLNQTGEINMSATDLEAKIDAEDLARAKDMVKGIVRDWSWFTWNDLLADDVTLSVKLGAIGVTDSGDFAAAGGDLQVTGRDDAKRALKGIYDDLKKHASITTEIVSGYEFALLGNLALPASNGNGGVSSFPIAVHLTFNLAGRIEAMTIASVDVHPLTAAIRDALETATVAPAA
jgi:hypothetical protein